MANDMMNDKVAIHRYWIPVDGKAHTVSMPPTVDDVLNIEAVERGGQLVLDFWFCVLVDQPMWNLQFTALGTGQEFAVSEYAVLGAADRLDGYVWHLARVK